MGCLRPERQPLVTRAPFRPRAERGPGSVVVTASGDGATGRSQDGEDQPDDDQDDPDRPQHGYAEDESQNKQDHTEGDHGEPPATLPRRGEGRSRDVTQLPGSRVGHTSIFTERDALLLG